MPLRTDPEHERISQRYGRNLINAQVAAQTARSKAAAAERSLADAEAAIPHRRADLDHYRRAQGMRANPGDIIQLETMVRIAIDASDQLRSDLAQARDAATVAELHFAHLRTAGPYAEWREHRDLIEATYAAAQAAHADDLAALGPQPLAGEAA